MTPIRDLVFRSTVVLVALGGVAETGFAAPAEEATPVESIRVPDGFAVDRLYVVPRKEQGSWVSMTVDPRGRLIASDQDGGIYRVTVPDEPGAAVAVERLSKDVGFAQGLLYAFDSLYVASQPKNARGESYLLRLTDSDGDDRFDKTETLLRLQGQGEHGPHAIVLGPDGRSIYFCAGNHTDLPPLARSYVPRVWQEDQLLPRMWDARGHAVGILAPGGWICRMQPDGSDVTLVSMGYRNQYDIAFNDAGDLFTFDSDMEWDVGTPWYRPTRICFAMKGSDLGWRSGSGVLPAIYPDTLPPTLDIGPGSPTGLVYGSQAKFPEKYRRSLFAADWSYGVIHAVELTEDGAGYSGKPETFCTASPLPVTDMVVRPQDGALYFLIGGRQTQSALYRIRYVGGEETLVQTDEPSTGVPEAGALRREFEAALLAPTPEVAATALAALDSGDRVLQYAARTLLEQSPHATWFGSLAQLSPAATIQAWIAVARSWKGNPDAGAVAMSRGVGWLSLIDWASLDREQRIDLLRAYALLFMRMHAPDAAARQTVLTQIDRHYPSDDRVLNQELCRLLVYLGAPGVAERTLDLIDRASSQEEQMHYAYCLRALDEGWTPATREAYFRWFNDAASFRGGMSFEGFLGNLRQEAIDRLPSEAKAALRSILDAKVAAAEPILVSPDRTKVATWTTTDLVAAIEGIAGEPDLERGRRVYAEASCVKCHRFDGVGGVVGPDLTAAGGRFNLRDAVEAIIEPDKVISDQYATQQFVLDDGRVVSGRVVNLKGEDLRVLTNPLDPTSIQSIPRGTIEQTQPSRTSTMPANLADYFTAEELADLVAYLRSGAVQPVGAN